MAQHLRTLKKSTFSTLSSEPVSACTQLLFNTKTLFYSVNVLRSGFLKRVEVIGSPSPNSLFENEGWDNKATDSKTEKDDLNFTEITLKGEKLQTFDMRLLFLETQILTRHGVQSYNLKKSIAFKWKADNDQKYGFMSSKHGKT